MTDPSSRTSVKSARWRALFVIHILLMTLLFRAVPLDAQEIIDPRSGQLVLTVTDITLPAGPITLAFQRTLEAHPNQQSLLGSRWRSNWESRVVSTPTANIIQQAPYAIAFSGEQGKREYRSSSGERLVVQGDGRFVRTMLSGRTETFDQQGRLVERDYRNGNKAIVRYGADGRIARIDGPRGSYIQFSADNHGRVTRIETSTGASVRYAYIGDNLTEIQVNGGPVVRYAYDTRGALMRIDNPRSGAVEFVYDARLRVVSRRWADGAQERFEYDDAAREQRHIDPIGAVTIIRFDQDGRRAEVIEPRGGKGAIAFDANGRPESVTGPTGETAKVVYDALGRPAAFHDPYGQVTRYEYVGATGRVKTIARPDGTQETLVYDPQQNVTEIRLGPQSLATLAYHPDGTVSAAKALGVAGQRLTYDNQGRLQTLTNPLGERLEFSYDARGNPLRAVNPLGGVTAWQWNAQDQLVSETDPLGATTRYEYDSSGRLTRAIDPLGRAIRFEYDLRGRLVAETDPSGQLTRYAYDRAGRLVKLSSGAASESFRYDPAGNLIEWVDRLGLTVQMEYDAISRVTQERWSTGLQVHYRYDARGQVAGIEDSAGRKLAWQHDGRGQIIAQRDALGATTQFQYDALGSITTRRDPRGHVKQFAYTADGALARVQEPSGDAAEYRYDAAHRLVEMVHPSGGRSRFAYNGLGHLTQEVDPLGHERRHQYDVAGRMVASTDAAGRVTRYTYDAAGRLTEKRFADGKHVAFKYNRVGNPLEADDGAFPVRYQYDREGRPVKVEYPAIKKTIAYEYDAAGLRTKLIGPDRRVTRYEYDGHKQLAAIIPPDGKPIALRYDAQQRLQSIRYPNGLIGTWEYDTAGRVTKLAYVHGSGKPISAWTYHYDPDGNLVRQKDTERRDTTYSYDAAGQLTEVAGSADMVRYRYGRGGSRVAVEAGAGVTSYRHDSANRLIEAGPEKLTYDANGNLVRREGPAGSTSYEYDAEDRLVRIQDSEGKATAFGYAPTGERVWKRDAGGLTYYLYDGLDLIQELDDKGNVKAAYVHGPAIDQPLAMRREEKSFYYHADRLGSVRALTDQSGAVAAMYDYDAFGKLETTRGGVPNPFTFTGRELDASTGLYYYRARYYDPALGRFLSTDPLPAALDEPLELNPYLYVRNQPLRFVDPLGLAPGDTVATRLVLTENDIARWKATKPRLQDWGRAGGLVNPAVPREVLFDPAFAPTLDLGRGIARPGPQQWPNQLRLETEHAQRGLDLDAERQRLKGLLPPGREGADLVAKARGDYNRGSEPLPPRNRAPGAPFAERSPARHLGGGVASFAEAEGGALARLKGLAPSPGTVALIALPAAADAIHEALWAEPGKRLEAAGESLGRSGHGLWESGKKMGVCAAVGAFIGGCFGNVPGAVAGAKIGAAVPLVIDAGKAASESLEPYVNKLKQLYPEPLPPGQQPEKSPGLVGSVSEGLPGAPPIWTPGGDPNVSRGGVGPTPEHIARAGEQQFGGGIPTQGPTSGVTGGGEPKEQGSYSAAPSAGTPGVGESGGGDPPPLIPDSLPPGAGDWSGTCTFKGGASALKFSIARDGVVTGNLRFGGNPMRLDGRLTGKTIQMRGTLEAGKNRITVTLNGQLNSNTEARGEASVEGIDLSDLEKSLAGGLAGALTGGLGGGVPDNKKPMAGAKPPQQKPTGSWSASKR